MTTPEHESAQTIESASTPPPDRRTLAPAWHTVVLIIGVLAISIAGKLQLSHQHHAPNRLATYATTAAMELAMLGWVAVGLRVGKVPFRSLFGAVGKGFRIVMLDLGIAVLFWIGSLTVLGTMGLLWVSVEYTISLRHASSHTGDLESFEASHSGNLHAVEQLAPANGTEVACWVLLCCLAGTIEEAVFRGYLQSQFTAWTNGSVVWGAAFSALLFGAAHGYQGARSMFLLAVFGALFSVLRIVRRNLRAGIFAHSWHDLIAGLVLTLLRSRHLL
jgi:hypothetical protein